MFSRYELIISGGHRCFLEMDVLIEMDGWLLCGGACFLGMDKINVRLGMDAWLR